MKTNLIANRIAGQIIGKQTRFANYLNRKTQHWNKVSKLTALIVFVLLFGGLSIYLILKSI
jgi:23S rRNA maturation-related 3'-5' exoribonuclease YhaM